MSTVGGYLEYRGGCSVPWGDLMINVGGYLEYPPHASTCIFIITLYNVCAVPWGVFSTVGDIMNTVGGLS